MKTYTDIGWSWVSAGASFAAIAGIMAAFTISAIVLLLSRSPDDGSGLDGRTEASQHLFYAFLVSLYSFVVSAILFANVTGATQPEGPTAYLMGTYGGTILAVGALQLLLAITWTAAEYHRGMSLRGAKALFGAVAFLAAVMVTLDHGDYFWAMSKSGIYWVVADPWLLAAGLLLMFFFPLGLGMFARWRIWLRHESEPELKREKGLLQASYRLHDIALWLSASVTTFLTLLAHVLGDMPAGTVAAMYQPWMSVAAMLLIGSCLFFFIWSFPYRDPLVESLRGVLRWLRTPITDSTPERHEAQVEDAGEEIKAEAGT